MKRNEIENNIYDALNSGTPYVLLRVKQPDEYDDEHAFAEIQKQQTPVPDIGLVDIFIAGRPFWSGSEWAMEEPKIFGTVESALDYIIDRFGISEMTEELGEDEWCWNVDEHMCGCDVCVIPRPLY